MKTPKISTPEVAKPTPIPQMDSPEMAAVQQENRKRMEDQEGQSGSLLTGSKGDLTDAGTAKKKLGYGSVAY